MHVCCCRSDMPWCSAVVDLVPLTEIKVHQNMAAICSKSGSPMLVMEITPSFNWIDG
jgi:hypothetical protein